MLVSVSESVSLSVSVVGGQKRPAPVAQALCIRRGALGVGEGGGGRQGGCSRCHHRLLKGGKGAGQEIRPDWETRTRGSLCTPGMPLRAGRAKAGRGLTLVLQRGEAVGTPQVIHLLVLITGQLGGRPRRPGPRVFGHSQCKASLLGR